MTVGLKQRTALWRLFAQTMTIWEERVLNFLHALNALCAEGLLNYTPVFHNLNFLQIRSEFPSSRFHREAAPISKLRRLPTTFTFSHVRLILSYLRGVNTCKRGSYHSEPMLSMRNPRSGEDHYDR
jgi:hypothetical protein